MLFLHGFPLDHRLWLDQLEMIDRHCVAIDLPGFGKSDPVLSETLTMDALADDVAAFLDGEPADIVSLSMGGYVALALWERHPHVVRSLVFMDTKAEADTDESRAGRRTMAEGVVADGAASLVEPMIDALLAGGAGTWAKARLRTMIEGTPVETIVAALGGMAARPDRTGLLASIDVPALVVVGDADRLIPVGQAEVMAKALPHGRLEVVADAGHLPPLEQPATVNRLLAGFLDS